jgi:hypothetical protein
VGWRQFLCDKSLESYIEKEAAYRI